MKTNILGVIGVSAAMVWSATCVRAEQAMNTVTRAEAAAGWVSLFDGKTPSGWRGYKKAGFPEKGWVIEDGTLRVIKGGGGGDIVTPEEYGDFELALEFKCAPAANSGIMYRCSEAKDFPWMTGPEFQVLDDSGHRDGQNAKHSVGALYDLIAPPANKPEAKPGEWNHARIRIKDGVLQHFLNGMKVVETRIDNEQWREMISASKFKQWPGFGLEKKGRIALQEHGDDVWFRNIKVRRLDAPMPGEAALFNGKDLTGWAAFVPDLSNKHQDPASIWRVSDGVLVCQGEPAGYLHTVGDYTNFVLKLEWRWSPETRKAGNSGVLFRLQEPHKVWPKSIEAQLYSQHAGDFWAVDDYPMTTDAARRKGGNTKATAMAERPVGEWNEYEIVVDGGDVMLAVNGEHVNKAWDCEVKPGKIALQSEGTEIHFRNVRIAEIAEPGASK
jgi:hypothetical protein